MPEYVERYIRVMRIIEIFPRASGDLKMEKIEYRDTIIIESKL